MKKKPAKKLPAKETPESKPDPRLKELDAEWEKLRAQHRPTAFELAQIAALMTGHDGWKKNEFIPNHGFMLEHLTVTDAALGLWENCARTIEKSIKHQKHAVLFPFGDPIDDEDDDGLPILFMGGEKFPMPFDDALKDFLFQRTKRRDERHKTFRDYLKDFYKRTVSETAKAEAEAQKRFDELKANGFDRKTLLEIGDLLPEWKARRRKLRAKIAADKRWGKK